MTPLERLRSCRWSRAWSRHEGFVGKLYLYVHYPAADILCNLNMQSLLSIMPTIPSFVRLIYVICSLHTKLVVQVHPHRLVMVPESFISTSGCFDMLRALRLARQSAQEFQKDIYMYKMALKELLQILHIITPPKLQTGRWRVYRSLKRAWYMTDGQPHFGALMAESI